MKVMIIGAGVIGTIYGWALSEAGHSVTHLVRPGRGIALENGIAVDILDRRKNHKKMFTGHYQIHAIESVHPLLSFDIIIVPVKHYVLEEVLKQILPLFPNSDWLLLTQNWRGTAGIRQLLSSSSYIFGDAKAGGCYRNNQLLATLSAIDLGSIDAGGDRVLTKAKSLFESADLKTTIQGNILHYLWVQYAINGGFWPALVEAGTVKKTLKNKTLMNRAFFSIRECLLVANARGVNLTEYPETKIYFTESSIKRGMLFLLVRTIFQWSKYYQRNTAHALSDPKEIKTFYDDLIETGRELGMAMPNMIGFHDKMDALMV